MWVRVPRPLGFKVNSVYAECILPFSDHMDHEGSNPSSCLVRERVVELEYTLNDELVYPVSLASSPLKGDQGLIYLSGILELGRWVTGS